MTAFVLSPGETDIRRVVNAVRGLAEGRSNAVGTATLTANAATTTVTAINCGAGCHIALTAKTANAAAALATTYIPTATVTAGQFIINHANNAQTDRTFTWESRG